MRSLYVCGWPRETDETVWQKEGRVWSGRTRSEDGQVFSGVALGLSIQDGGIHKQGKVLQRFPIAQESHTYLC